MHKTLRLLREKLEGFRNVWIALALFLSINITVFAIIQYWPGVLNYLWLSHSNPWGIVTANFTHRDAWHIEGNIRDFLILTAFFIVICWILPKKTCRRLSRKFLGLPFLAAIAAAAVLYFTNIDPLPGAGASTITSGALGVVLVALIAAFPANVQAIETFIAENQKRRRRTFAQALQITSSLISLVLALILILLTSNLITATSTTVTVNGVNVTAGVNAHRLSLLFGFFPALALERHYIAGSWRNLIRRMRKWPSAKRVSRRRASRRALSS